MRGMVSFRHAENRLFAVLLLSQLCMCLSQMKTCGNTSSTELLVFEVPSYICSQGRIGLAAQLLPGSVYNDGSLTVNHAFRWLGRHFTSFHVNVRSYITFGKASNVASAFGALNPPLPTLFVGAASGNVLTQLYYGNDAGGRGVRLRFEGSTQASGSPTNIVWEVLIKNDGAMELCTGPSMATGYGGLTAVSNGISSSLITTLDLQPSSLKSLITTCDPCSRLSATSIYVSDETSSTTCMQGPTGLTAQLTLQPYNNGFVGPFNYAFRWLGRHFTSFHVNVRSYITFGDASNVASAFGALNPPLPTLFVGAASGNVLTQLYYGNDAGGRGVRLRFEGSTQASGSPTNIVWEVLIKNDGAMELCTGPSMATGYGGLTAVSNGISSSLITTLDLQPSSLKSLITTCDPLGIPLCTPSISLSNTYQKTSGVLMAVVFTPAVAVASGSQLVITLSGLGLSFPTNAALVFTQPASGASGSANITGGPTPVLTALLNTTAGTFAAGNSVRFVISSVTTPKNAQPIMSEIYSSLVDTNRAVITRSNVGEFPQVLTSCSNMSATEIILIDSINSSCMQGPTGLTAQLTLRAYSTGSLGPFNYAFRWLGRHFTSFYVNVKSYITFGDASNVASAFGALNPPLPTLFVGAASGNVLTQLYYGNDAGGRGVRLRFEGSTQASGSPTNIVWEVLIKNDGAMELCTGPSMATGYGGLTAVSNGISSSLITTLDLQPSSLKSLITTCDPLGIPLCTPSISLSNTYQKTSGVLMAVVFTPAVAVASGSQLVITLSGLGLSFPTNAALVFTQPASGASGSANITGGPTPVLTALLSTTAGTFAAGSSVRFVISSVTTPTNAQAALTGVLSAVLSSSGSVVAETASGSFSEIKLSTLGTNEPVVTLSVPVRNTSGVLMAVVFTPAVAVASGSQLVITLSGLGLSFPTNAALVFTQPASGASGSANITGGPTPVLTALLSTTAGTFAAGSSVRFVISSVTTPTNAQAALTGVLSAVLSSSGSVVAETASGSFSEIKLSTLGTNEPVVTLSVPVRNTSGVLMAVVFTPAVAVASGSQLVITLSGLGLSFPTNAALVFTQPASGASGSANITGGPTPVLTALLSTTAGTFAAGSSVRFVISSVTTPTNAQAALTGVLSAVLSSSGSVVAETASGSFSEIKLSTLGTNEPVVTLSVPVRNTSGVLMAVVFTPAVAVASGSQLVITLSGLGLSFPTNAALVFTQPASGASGSANITGGPTPVLTALLSTTAGTFAAGSSVRFVISSVTTPTNAQAALTGVLSAIMSVSGEVISRSTVASFSAVFGNFGGHPFLVEFLSSSANDGSLRLSFVPTFIVPSGGSVIVSIFGAGINLSNSRFASTSSTFGSSFVAFQQPSFLVLILNVSSGHIVAGSNVSFLFTSVRGICNATSNAIKALTTDSFGATLDLSTSVIAISSSDQLTVQDFIKSALNGVVRVPSGFFMGFCNCNNTVTSVFPARPHGATVHLIGDSSVIDCSGTGLRCLSVVGTSINISGIVFKGGTSPGSMSDYVLKTALSFFHGQLQAVSSHFVSMQHTYDEASVSHSVKHQKQVTHRVLKKSALSRMLKKVPPRLVWSGNKAREPDASANIVRVPLPASAKATNGRYRGSRPRAGSRLLKNFILKPRKSINFKYTDAASFFKFTHRSSSAPNRRLLQSSSSSIAIDQLPENDSGGCVLIQSPQNAIWISMSSFVECSSV
jgi:hypothetical protein